MTEKEFKKYEGKRTIGRLYSHTLSGGRIVGYSFPNSPSCDFLPLLAIDDENGWAPPALHKAVIPNEKDRKEYLDGKHKYLWVRVSNVCMDKELDLTEILKGCEGLELWSDICGKCVFIKIDDEDEEKHPICVEVTEEDGRILHECFSNNGRYNSYYSDGKCLLWPSETNRDWSTFKKPVRWVVCSDNISTGGCISREDEVRFNWKYIIPYDKFRLDLTEHELNNLNINRK